MKSKPNMLTSGGLVEKSFCTTREAGALLGVSAGTVQLWVESGLLQAWKTAGGHRRVLRDSVEQLLPRKPTSVPLDSSRDALSTSSSRRMKIVVVDDDEHMLRLYQVNMAQWPMAPNITIFNDAIAALLSIGRIPPDLLVTDLHMPGMDGFNMLRVLCSAPEIPDTKIVVASGLDSIEIKQRGGVPPGVEILPKPVPFDRLLAIATDIFKQGRFQRPPN